jgi:AraC-like DNA-binding protein
MGEWRWRRLTARVGCEAIPVAEDEQFEELTIDGDKAHRWVIHCADCPELSVHRISHLGMAEGVPPYRIVRVHPSGSFLLATTHGEGRVMLDGRWQRVKEGSLVMAPPRVLNAFYVPVGKVWNFAYVRYAEPSFVRAIVGASSPVRAAGGGKNLARCIEGLWDEWTDKKSPRMIHHWVSLVQGAVQRAAQPEESDDRLAGLWAKVGASLDAPWTLETLAGQMHCGIEQLRRRCQLEMGRSPMHQVAYMRMQRAQTLLETTHNTLDAIAQDLGFSDGLVFSRAFKRWIGMNPRDYRARK